MTVGSTATAPAGHPVNVNVVAPTMVAANTDAAATLRVTFPDTGPRSRTVFVPAAPCPTLPVVLPPILGMVRLP
jgi:hypothetical protein